MHSIGCKSRGFCFEHFVTFYMMKPDGGRVPSVMPTCTINLPSYTCVNVWLKSAKIPVRKKYIPGNNPSRCDRCRYPPRHDASPKTPCVHQRWCIISPQTKYRIYPIQIVNCIQVSVAYNEIISSIFRTVGNINVALLFYLFWWLFPCW